MFKINFNVIYSNTFDITIIKYKGQSFNLNKRQYYSFLRLAKKDKELQTYIKKYLQFNKNNKLKQILKDIN